MQDKIIEAINSHGYKAQFASAHHAKDLRVQIDSLLEQGKIDKQLYDSYLGFDYSFSRNDIVPESLLVVAVPMPITTVDFELNDAHYPAVIPPIYLSSQKLSIMKSTISNIMESYGYNISRCRLPSKLVATSCGLAQYGRNNITYIPSMGSFYSITVFGSDMELTQDNCHEPKMMASCKTCTICIDNCPTKCINRDSTIIDASKCLTFFNEDDKDFPSWIDPSWHNSLIGCMRCQISCPHNKDYINNVDKSVSFTPQETRLFLEDTPYSSLDETTKIKLKNIECDIFYDSFKRNLKVLIEKIR